MTPGETLSIIMASAALIVALVTVGAKRRVALFMVAGVLASRAMIWGIPDLRFVGCAAVLVLIGTNAMRKGMNCSGALLIAAGLCYFMQEHIGPRPTLGNPLLMLSEVLWWLALLGVYRGRLVGLSDEIGPLVGNPSGRGDRRSAVDRPSIYAQQKVK